MHTRVRSAIEIILAALLVSVSQNIAAAQDQNGVGPEQERIGPDLQPPVAVGPVAILQVRPNIYMLTVAATNIALEVGADGAIVVDTGPPGNGNAIVRAIRTITDQPIRYIIDTSADPSSVGNNATISQAGSHLGSLGGPFSGISNTLGINDSSAPITSYQNVLNTMISSPPGGQAYPSEALPGEFFDTPEKNFYLNGEQIDLIWEPAAHSDGDTVVVFRRDDVIVTGATFDMTRFPIIDLKHGGSIQGEIDAINRLMDTEVTPVTPLKWREGLQYGTLVIPGRGQLSEQAEMVQYRDMLTIIRDRVAYYIKQGKSLAQIEALRPAAGYASRFGADTGPWTTDMFIEAVYDSLKGGGVKSGKK